MPLVQPPLHHDRPSLKDDVPAPRRPSPPLKLRPESPKVKDKVLASIGKPLPADESKPKRPAEPEPADNSEYAKLEDDSDLKLMDKETFQQILELDEDEGEREFSKSMVWDYFEQAEKTFDEMDVLYVQKDLETLSQKGHFLKGSSASFGLKRVESSCQMIQHCGEKRDEKNPDGLETSVALEIMGRLLKKVRLQYGDAKAWLEDFFENDRTLEEDD